MLTTLVTFTGTANGSYPQAGLTTDAAGDLYGTTYAGGANGEGTIFELPAGSSVPVTLVAFNQSTGVKPAGPLTIDAAGNLYGTASQVGPYGGGTVFELAAGSHAPTVLAAFNGTNGMLPGGGLVLDPAGNLYGTSYSGGQSNVGTLFEVAARTHAFSTLASFNQSSGGNSLSGLVADRSGNVYGTTTLGGANSSGTLFEFVASTRSLTTLAVFNGSTTGSSPSGGLAVDPAGDLFGTTAYGSRPESGSVFEVAAGTHVLTTVALTGTPVESGPFGGGVTIDAAGDLFGTVAGDGSDANGGSVFEVLAGTHTAATLATFTGPRVASLDGSVPYGGVVADAAGDLYGTTQYGGSANLGTVYEITGSGFVVPEPATAAALAVGGLALLARRRGRPNGGRP